MKPRNVWIVKTTWWRRNEYGVHDTFEAFDFFTSERKAQAAALEITSNEDDGELMETFVFDREVL